MLEIKKIIQEFPQGKKGKVIDWGEMKLYFPNDLPESELNLLRGYFKAQLNMKEGKHKKADEIFDALDKNPDFLNLEEEKENLFASIDIAVRGETNRGKTSGTSF